MGERKMKRGKQCEHDEDTAVGRRGVHGQGGGEGRCVAG